MITTSHQSMLGKIIIVDFEDSFTYNIANILYSYEEKCEVISHQHFFTKQLTSLPEVEKIAVILGPGPGHPDQYIRYHDDIKKLINKSNVYLMGICLGHQLMARVEGKIVSHSLVQMHGQTIEIEFKGIRSIVQRYNSLSVYENGVELNIGYYQNGISYQFHPESIGTLQNDIFFEDLLTFIKCK
jgi:anthranilate/para-aminobenzoate synthase component II